MTPTTPAARSTSTDSPRPRAESTTRSGPPGEPVHGRGQPVAVASVRRRLVCLGARRAGRRVALAPCDHESGVLARRASSGRGLDRLGIEAAACDEPRGHRVGVPPLTCPELVAPPYGRRDALDEVKHALRAIGIVGQAPRALNGLVDVGESSRRAIGGSRSERSETGPPSDYRQRPRRRRRAAHRVRRAPAPSRSPSRPSVRELRAPSDTDRTRAAARNERPTPRRRVH